jgi:hypothetical protein
MENFQGREENKKKIKKKPRIKNESILNMRLN